MLSLNQQIVFTTPNFRHMSEVLFTMLCTNMKKFNKHTKIKMLHHLVLTMSLEVCHIVVTVLSDFVIDNLVRVLQVFESLLFIFNHSISFIGNWCFFSTQLPTLIPRARMIIAY